MQPVIQNKLEQMDQRRRALLDRVEALEPGRLVAKPLPGKWSILEIVDHLVTAERDVLQNLPDPAQLVDRPRRLKHRIRYPIVLFVLKYNISVPVPTPRMLPRGITSLAELRRQWDESQDWLRRYVGGLDQEGLQRAVFRHPVSGPLTVTQVLRMGRVHVEHHEGQIERLIALTG